MRNHVIVALRNLNRERLYAAINIVGLALGIACCLILAQYLRNVLSYDRHNVKHERIYRLVNEFTANGSTDRYAVTSRIVGPMLISQYPAEIAAVTRIMRNSSPNNEGIAIRHGDDVSFWKASYFADDNIFDVFTHHIVFGNPKTALKDGSSVAISESVARRFFGAANPVGENLTTDEGLTWKISLVYADLPANSHLKYDLLFSSNAPFLRDSDNPTARRSLLWNITGYTYLLATPQFKPADWPRINDEFYEREMAATGKTLNSHWRSELQPLADVHLKSDVGYDEPTGNPAYLYGCAAIAVFILFVACINYMNLATARATGRARATGIRKILGASRVSLALQFLGEAILFALLAVALGIVIVELALTFTPINTLMDGQVSLDLLHDPLLAAWLLGGGLLIGLLAGIYPALYLSAWAPLSALTGTHSARGGGARLREALVLLQFTISAAVIACTLLMAAQMRYVAQKSLGFDRENRLVVTLRGVSTIEKLPTLRTELLKNPHVLGVAEALSVPGQNTAVNLMQIDNDAGVLTATTMFNMPVGVEFPSVMGMKLVKGRDFSQRLLTDVGVSVLVNEATVRKMGWTEPLGKRVQAGPNTGRVVGVVQDFNYKSLRTLIEPFAMFPINDDFSQVPELRKATIQRLMVLNISGDDVSATLEFIGNVMRQADPRHPFEYSFLDQQLDALYKSEHQLTMLSSIFSAICIFIACLGLFGLAAFTTERRTREIGTRKVLGASTLQIILMLSRRTLVLVLIASIAASVIAFFAIDEWLSGFAYHARINPLVFLLAGLVAAAVAFATVALQSWKTASADPVNALRHV